MSSPVTGTSLGQGRNDRVPFQVTVPASAPIVHDSTPWKVELDCEDDDSEGKLQVDESETVDGFSLPRVDATKTMLVPVRDPLSMEMRNMLVPVEARDASGLNVIKSVLVPVEGIDGLVSYEIKNVVVPINESVSRWSEGNKPRTKLVGTKAPEKQVPSQNCKAEEEKENEEKRGMVTEEKAKLQGRNEIEQWERDIRNEQTILEREAATSAPVIDAPKGEMDQILDTLRNVCPICQKCFKDEEEMQNHAIRTHKKPYKCDKCRKGYFSDFALEEHQKTHEVVSFYQCSICQLQYKTTIGLKNHQAREHSNIDPKFTCDYCGKRFKLKKDLSNHIERSHMNNTYICRFCGITVKDIVQHELKHEQTNQKKVSPQYRCNFCRRRFKAWNSLENHLLMKHKNPKDGSDLLRTLCEKKFESRSDFYQHMHSQADAKRHKCDVCDKTFASEYNLRNHTALHSQTYLCPQCGKNLTSNNSLKLHLRKHTGEKPYQCKVCLKAFARSTSLRVHKLTHTGERPYICDLCGSRFTQRSSMMTHRRKHPGDHPPPPPLVLSRVGSNEH